MIDVKNVVIVVLTLSLIIISYLFSKTKKPAKFLFLSSILGILFLVGLNLFSDKLGFSIGYNFYTAGVSVILGIPGVVLMIILKAMMFI